MLSLSAGLLLLLAMPAGIDEVYAQHPTGSIPTVTGTPAGPRVTVPQNLNQVAVRAGPGQIYPEIGLLVLGQEAPAIGTSPGEDWIQIVYVGVPGGVGWVYGFLVHLSGPVPVVPVPPTPTPRVTPTINPTLAARFLEGAPPTRLPTFTVPPPLILPTIASEDSTILGWRSIPMGFVIIGLAVVGLFGITLSVLRGR